MDGHTFDRLARALAGSTARRAAMKALAGGGLAVAGATAGVHDGDAKKKKKRCRKPGQACGGQKKCCKDKGPTVCQDFPPTFCKGVDLTGNRCCGLEGAKCNPNFGTPIENMIPTSVGNCSCCDPLYCGKQANGEFRCQVEDT